MGGGPCNMMGPCTGDNATDIAYCPGENYCVYEGDCYKGDGSAIVDIDGIALKHDAVCVGFAWWDCDTGLPGMDVCEEQCGYTWAKAGEEGVGEYAWGTMNDFSCCGDDASESFDEETGLCWKT